MTVVKFKYKTTKSWNCDRICETEEKLEEWLEHEKKVGNAIEKISENEYIVKIDY